MKLNGAKWEPDVGDVVILKNVTRSDRTQAAAHLHTKKTGEFGTTFYGVIQSDKNPYKWLEVIFTLNELHFNERGHHFECFTCENKMVERECTVKVANGVYFVSGYIESEVDGQPLVEVKTQKEHETTITKVEYTISNSMFLSKVECLDNGLARGVLIGTGNSLKSVVEQINADVSVERYTCPIFIVDENNVKTDGGPVPMEPDFAVYYAGWHINEYGNMVAY